MQTKICSKCKVEKPISEFYKAINYKLGVRAICKKCDHIYKTEHYINNNEYYQKNKDSIRIYQTNYVNLKRKTNINYRITDNLRRRLNSAIKTNSKSQSTLKLLGCVVSEFKIYLESKFQPGMTWNNYGRWEIDHIRPCASFDLSKPHEQKKCFNWTNLQPLWKKDNRVKSDN